jgi:hypothetical protein
LETVYEKVLGELAVNKDKFDLGDILKTPGAGSSQGGQTRPEGGFEIDGPNEDKESNGKKDGQFVDQEQLQEEVEFFKGMLSGSSPDADTGFSGQFKFEFEQKTEKVHDDYVIELPRETHGDPTLNLGDATPHKTVLENNLINSYNATISFDRTEHNSPGTRSPVFKWESDPDHLFQFNNPDSEVQVPESNESHQPPQQTVPFMHFEPPKQETSSEGFNFPDINVKKKRAKIFDDEDQAVVPSPIQQNTQENWKFNERPSEGSRVHSPFQPQVYGFPPQEESHSFNIGENSGLPGAVSDQKPTEVPTIRQPKLPDFSTGDFDLPPPPTDSSGQVEDNGFGGFELGWKKQKHNFMDNEPDSQPYRPPQMIEQPAGSNPVILGPYPPQAEQPNFQTNPAHNPYIQGPVHVFPHPAMFNTPYPVHAHQGPQDYPPSPIFHPPGSNIGWQPPVEVPQPKQPTFMPLDNFDLLSLEVVPTELIKPQDNTSRKQVVNPFEDSPEKETPSLQPIIDVPKQTEIAPKLTEKPIVEVKKLAPEAPIPSLNNFRVLQQEILTYQEQSGKSTLELTGCLLLKADQGIAVSFG